MCWQCDHPGTTWNDYLEHLRELLERHCWVVQGVQRERHRPPYAYTVGLTAHDRPELIVTGMPYDRAVKLLNGVAEHVLHAEAPPPGEVIPLRRGPVIEIVRVTEPSVHLTVAAALNGPQFSALQLVYADDRGHWPWDVYFRGGNGGQPVLGARGAVSGRPSDQRKILCAWRTLVSWARFSRVRCTSSAGRTRGGWRYAPSC